MLAVLYISLESAEQATNVLISISFVCIQNLWCLLFVFNQTGLIRVSRASVRVAAG